MINYCPGRVNMGRPSAILRPGACIDCESFDYQGILWKHPGVMLVYFHQSSQNGRWEALAVASFVQNDGAEVILQLDITPHQ